MKFSTKKQALVSAAILGLLSMGLATSANAGGSPKATDESVGECHGANACKGQGACGGKGNSCAGQNGCKGQGWLKLSEKECTEKGGQFKKD